MFGEIPRYQHATEGSPRKIREVTNHRRLSSEIECCAATGALEYHCLDEFLWMKSRESIGLKGVTASHRRAHCNGRGCQVQGLSVELDVRPNCNVDWLWKL